MRGLQVAVSTGIKDGLLGVTMALVVYLALVLFQGTAVTRQLEPWQTQATDCWPRLP